MEYMTGYYRRQGEETALLLQQYICRGIPLFLGCICGGEGPGAGMAGGLLTGRLLEGFRRIRLSKAAGKPEWAFKRMEQSLRRCRKEIVFPEDFWTAGILCIGGTFLAFYRGRARLILCQTGFGRPVLWDLAGRDSTETQKLQLRRGSMEKGIGILLASEGFCGQLSGEELKVCLAVKDIKDSGQTLKRIRELGLAAEKRGGRNMAALLLEIR